jgi:hypothetical protein
MDACMCGMKVVFIKIILEWMELIRLLPKALELGKGFSGIA